MNKSLSKDAKFLLDDLIKRHSQASWDWEADCRFAKYLKRTDDVELIRETLHSGAPGPIRIGCSTLWKPITQRRLRGLRELVKAKLACAGWIGLGPGALNEFGVRRSRYYYALKENQNNRKIK